MFKRILALILAIASCAAFIGCGGTEKNTDVPDGTGTESESESETGTEVSGDGYVKKYGDFERAEAWLRKNITDAKCPPVGFVIGGENSNDLTWTKQISEKKTVTDYPNTAPVQREVYTVTFTNDKYNVAVAVEVTSYPGFPIVEYEPTLINLSDDTSAEIANVNGIDRTIYEGKEDMTVHYYTGSSMDGKSDYVEKTKEFDATLNANRNRFDTMAPLGKPTSTTLPDMNIETSRGDGVITVLSWQGSWGSTVTLEDDGLKWTAGQFYTNFNLLGKEIHRAPAVVLIYYKESRLYGQNIYRRWFYGHNFMRVNGVKMGTNILVSTANQLGENIVDIQGTANGDKTALRGVKAFGFNTSVDRFCQDAGWNVYGGESSWYNTVGNWTEDTKRYPNGLKEISDLARSMDLGYTLWIEPERVRNGTDITKEHPEYVIFCGEVGGEPRYFTAKRADENSDGLMNLGNKEACDYVIDMVDGILTKAGADSYRQDFNFYPAPYWAAYDQHESKNLNIKRYGRTEEQYCNGYLRLFDTLIERHPGLTIDACASGGMRYDLATARRAYCHTRTDWFNGAEKAQSDTYVTAQWMVYWGTAFDTTSNYGLRSRIASDVGIGIVAAPGSYDYKSYYTNLKRNINQWRELSSYIYEDYYPLTDYIGMDDDGVLAMEFDCPSKGTGMVVIYIRGDEYSGTVKLFGLDENASYTLKNYDDRDDVVTATGKELMENGIAYEKLTKENSSARTAKGKLAAARVYMYEKVK